jgi:hypothetical protein
MCPIFKNYKRQEAEIQGLHPAEGNRKNFLVRFQSVKLPSTQSEISVSLIPVARQFHVSLRYVLSYEQNFP